MSKRDEINTLWASRRVVFFSTAASYLLFYQTVYANSWTFNPVYFSPTLVVGRLKAHLCVACRRRSVRPPSSVPWSYLEN